MFKVNNGNTRPRCKICSKLTIKTPGRRKWYLSGVLIINFEHISYLILGFLYKVNNTKKPNRKILGSESQNLCILPEKITGNLGSRKERG